MEPQIRTVGEITYQLTRRKVKNINMRVHRDGSVAVSAHPKIPLYLVDEFVLKHSGWVADAREKQRERQEQLADQPLPSRGEALARFTVLCEYYLPYFEEPLHGELPVIRVRDMSSRWGVCNPGRRTVTFALRLAAMPLPAQEYVVVHELCHFLQLNHSPAFWAEVEKILPDWKERRKMLR